MSSIESYFFFIRKTNDFDEFRDLFVIHNLFVGGFSDV